MQTAGMWEEFDLHHVRSIRGHGVSSNKWILLLLFRSVQR